MSGLLIEGTVESFVVGILKMIVGLAGITFQQGRIRSGGGGTDGCWRERETWEGGGSLCRTVTTDGSQDDRKPLYSISIVFPISGVFMVACLLNLQQADYRIHQQTCTSLALVKACFPMHTCRVLEQGNKRARMVPLTAGMLSVKDLL